MNRNRPIAIVGIILNLAGMVSAAEDKTTPPTRVSTVALNLQYAQPATEWIEALPLGNGRLGAMIYGGIQQEHLQLNEDTLWSGGPHSYDNPEAYQHLAKVREQLQHGEYRDAEETAQKMLGKHKYQQAYLPLGDLFLDFPNSENASEYRRDLNLQTAVSTVTYRIGRARFTRTIFASHPDQSIVMRLECDTPGQITFDLSMTSLHAFHSKAINADTLLMTGQVGPRKEATLIAPWQGDGTKFAAEVKVFAKGGEVTAQGDKISVTDADAVTLVYAAATSYVNSQDVSGDPLKSVDNYIANAGEKTFAQLHRRHVDDYSKLFDRVAINLGGKQVDENLPTDQRLKRLSEGNDDPQLIELLFQYGRYLMIAG